MNILLISLVALGAFYFAYKATPAKDKQGSQLQGDNPKLEKKQTLTIGTYNVQTGKDENGKRNIYRSAEVIKNADIVGIQEVYAKPWLGTKGQTECLASTGKFNWLFAATRRRWFREHRGNALLSKLAISEWKIEQLPDETGKQFRNLVTAIVPFNGIDVAILVTHLHTKKGRERQLDFVFEAFEQYEHAILLGDFNTNKENSQLQNLLNNPSISDSISIADSAHDNNERIDWIVTKGFSTVSGTHTPIGISDHPYYEVKLKLD